MSIEGRHGVWAVSLLVGAVLLLFCGFGALGSIQHVWRWRGGEVVEFKVTSDSCHYTRRSGTLSGCKASWTTGDGTQHTGKVVGTVGQLGLRGKEPWRASGEGVYAKPRAFTNFVGLTAPFAGGIGLVALVVGLVSRPSKAKWEQARTAPLPAAVTTLAQSNGLGDEQGRYWGTSSATQGVLLFEHGFVLAWAGETTAHRWDDATAVFERSVPSNKKMIREYVILFGEDWLSFNEETVDDIMGLGKVFVNAVTSRMQPKVAAALGKGEAYLFPRWGSTPYLEFTAEGVGGEDGMIRWPELAAADIQSGQIVVRAKDGRSLVRSWGDTGNAGMLVIMLRSMIAGREDRNPVS